jgi:Gram-negative bacterial TonB protein C-terminal
MQHCFKAASIVMAFCIVCCSIVWTQETLSERETVLAALTGSYGHPIEGSSSFAVTEDYILKPVFSGQGLLIEIAIEPRAKIYGQRDNRSVDLSDSEFQSILANINSIKPLGPLEEELGGKFGTAGRAWGSSRYRNGYLQTAELLGEAPPRPVVFAYIYYLHEVTGIAKLPIGSKPEDASSFGLVCIGGVPYIAPKSEFLKLWSKPNTRQTVLLAGPTRDDCSSSPAVGTPQGIVGDIPGGLPPDGTNVSGGILSSEPQSLGVASSNHVRVSQGVMRGLLITKVNPNYPPEAERQHVDGAVLLHIHIDKSWNVSKVDPVSGHPLLIPAALEAVKQWKYRPYLLNQKPVEVETTVLIKFIISGGNV